jgi:Ca-activated chloride channel family protein
LRARPGEYVLSTVGVGHGFDESLMAALADAGTGNFYYVTRGDDLGDVFAGEFASARAQLASALAVELAPAPGVELLSASGYPLRFAGESPSRVGFEPGPLFAGQVRRIWLTLRVANGSAAPAQALGSIAVHYTRDGVRRAVELDALPAVAVVDREEDYLAGLASEVWAASVAEDELGALKQSVAGALQRDDAEAAQRALLRFRSETARLNESVASPAVAGVLDAVGQMESDVARAAAPAMQPVRNELSKKYTAEAQDERRPGAKHGAK